MNLVRREVKVTGATIEKAVADGLEQLGLNRSEAIVDIIDEGSRGILGLGSREAVVIVKEITPTGTPEPEKPPVPQPKPQAAAPKPATPEQPKPAKVDPPATPKQEAAPTPEKKVEPAQPEPPKPKPEPVAQNKQPAPVDSVEENEKLQQEEETAVEVIETLLQKMNVEAAVSAKRSDVDDVTGRRMNIIQINGDDLGVLIGPRGETLGSLQYISRLMVGHKLHQRANFAIDVEGYRERREQALQRLAERMAGKVVKRGRAMTLEPMPPNERRIIHMTLRDHDEVKTQSVGEGDRRKVRILLKKK